ncbi:aldehyde dehydrogenase family protein [Niveispirillum fermenti]|uniref:aldehyde dehydrogenase family protein n=1 Tax=Niveispirillum fermenti TaxID=1233113 RepID=UPI003A845B6C
MSMMAAAGPQAGERFLEQRHAQLIGGEWRPPATGRVLDVLDPATGEVIAQAPDGDAADIDAAVTAARAAHEGEAWRGLTSDARARILWRYADLIEANGEELAWLEVRNNGMPLGFANWAIGAGASWLRHYAGLTANIFGRNASSALSGGGQHVHAYTRRQPVGVAGLILPWNGPIGAFLIKVAPALAAGCCLVVKPAENTPLTALRLGELALEAGLPAGVLNIVSGHGATAGAALAAHPGVDKISFTGSTAIGRQIVAASAGNLKRVTLELGGKSPCIVCDDADMDQAIPGAAMAIFANSGQVCFAGSRLFVQRRSFDRVVDGIAGFMKGLKVGSGLDPDTVIGPLISARQRDRVRDFIDSGRAQGAELVAGGGARDGAGFFLEPTLFANVRADMRIASEEIFGPVLVATPFDDLDEVVRAANGTRYGLGAGIFTGDVNKAHLLADRIEAGNIWINSYGLMHPTMPFGGFKESGWGREMGTEGMEAFLETKSVYVQLHG